MDFLQVNIEWSLKMRRIGWDVPGICLVKLSKGWLGCLWMQKLQIHFLIHNLSLPNSCGVASKGLFYYKNNNLVKDFSKLLFCKTVSPEFKLPVNTGFSLNLISWLFKTYQFYWICLIVLLPHLYIKIAERLEKLGKRKLKRGCTPMGEVNPRKQKKLEFLFFARTVVFDAWSPHNWCPELQKVSRAQKNITLLGHTNTD